MTKQVIEIVEFKLKAGVSTEDFLAEVEKTKAFITSLKGFIDRHIAQDENGNWVDIAKWQDMASAQEAAAQFQENETVKDFCMMIDFETTKMSHFEVANIM